MKKFKRILLFTITWVIIMSLFLTFFISQEYPSTIPTSIMNLCIGCTIGLVGLFISSHLYNYPENLVN